MSRVEHRSPYGVVCGLPVRPDSENELLTLSLYNPNDGEKPTLLDQGADQSKMLTSHQDDDRVKAGFYDIVSA